MKSIIIIFVSLICFSCKTKKTGLIEIKNAVLLHDTLKPIGSVESWIQEPMQYKGKTVMLWDVDDIHFGRIEVVYDSAGAINGLIEKIRDGSSEIDKVVYELGRVRDQLKSMHDNGRCPLGEQYYNEVVTDSFTLISGCYTKKEHEKELSTGDRPRLEISATITNPPPNK